MLILLSSLALLQATSAATPQPAPLPRCDSEAHAGFDFWVGEWDVFPNGQENKVEALLS